VVGGDRRPRGGNKHAQQQGTTVTLSHRSEAFSRARTKNRAQSKRAGGPAASRRNLNPMEADRFHDVAIK
jgi:hypothetical protein